MYKKYYGLTIILGFLFFYAINPTFSQSIELQKGNRTKSIEVGKYVNIQYAKKDNDIVDGCCTHKVNVTGYLVDVSDGKIMMEVDKYIEYKTEDDFILETSVEYKIENKEIEIEMSKIFRIKKFRNEKAYKRNTSGAIIGGLGVFTGSLTIIHALFINGNKESFRRLGLIGLVEIGVGIVSLCLFAKPSFDLKEASESPWRIINLD